MKIWSLLKHENLRTGNKILMKRGEIAPNFFEYISYFRSQVTYSFVKCGCSIYFVLNSANLICRGTGTDISKYWLWDNESTLHKSVLCAKMLILPKCVFRGEHIHLSISVDWIWNDRPHRNIEYRIRPNYRTVRLGFSNLLGTLIRDKICTS